MLLKKFDCWTLLRWTTNIQPQCSPDVTPSSSTRVADHMNKEKTFICGQMRHKLSCLVKTTTNMLVGEKVRLLTPRTPNYLGNPKIISQKIWSWAQLGVPTGK